MKTLIVFDAICETVITSLDLGAKMGQSERLSVTES